MERLAHAPLPAADECRLVPGRALTLRPRRPGVLTITRGAVWATLDGPHAPRAGDLFLHAGACLPLRAGQRVVLEWHRPGGGADGAACVGWQSRPADGPATRSWESAVAQPASDLRRALAGAAAAAGRLALGAAAFATGLIAFRVRGTRTLAAFKAESNACSAHGRIA